MRRFIIPEIEQRNNVETIGATTKRSTWRKQDELGGLFSTIRKTDGVAVLGTLGE